MNFNNEQAEAIRFGELPLLVLSAAGTGKTMVLTHRGQYLVQEKGIDPATILMSTFTKKAATEMTERLEGLIGEAAVEAMTVGTIHSFCLRFLNAERRSMGKQPYIPKNVIENPKYTIKRLVGTGRIDELGRRGLGMEDVVDVTMAISKISLWKRSAITPKESFDHAEILPDDHFYSQIYTLYEEYKRATHKIDFDDMPLKFWELLRDDAGVRAKYQKMFRYVLVDEYQDTDMLQNLILTTIAKPENHITFVGDDDQSIYGWRGARPELMLEFKDAYPDGDIVTMELNYRSVPTILTTANRVIKHNKNRYDKELKPFRDGGLVPVVERPADLEEEGRYVGEQILSLDLDDYSDVAILYRTNAQAEAVESSLMARKIPYEVVGSRGFYGRRDVMDVMAYLTLAVDETGVEADDAVLRIFNVPLRFLGAVFRRNLESIQAEEDIPLFEIIRGHRKYFQDLWGKQHANLDEFVRTVEGVREMVQDGCYPFQLVSHIRGEFYDDHIKKDSDNSEDSDAFEVLNRLSEVSENYETIEEFLDFYYTMTGAKSVSENEELSEGSVKLMTIHKSKGLEFPYVFGIGITQGLLPHCKSAETEAGLEEERRLAYVLITRAKEMLFLSAPKRTIGDREGTPSQFLFEGGLLNPIGEESVLSTTAV